MVYDQPPALTIKIALGYIEVSVSLPGSPNVPGFWPGAWTMANLGRPGYGATTDGVWPLYVLSPDLSTWHLDKP